MLMLAVGLTGVAFLSGVNHFCGMTYRHWLSCLLF
jgi:hypothetical protein